MRVCEQLEPRNVFRYFEDICSIPHGSQNTKAISDYCVSFAKEHHLKWIQDDMNNVILFKEGSKGYEDAAPVIIQGHMDMVCEKESGADIDFEADGLNLYIEDGFLKASGTTLGGDDGIALAYAFAILSDDTIPHPPLEVVITVDEEIGMLGAQDIDLSMLKGRKLLNIDSDEEGVFLTSCAGGLTAECELPISRTSLSGTAYQLDITGLAGGHSGTEIQKEHGNAIMLMGRLLKQLADEVSYSLIHIEGGLKDNAIPREAVSQIILDEAEEDKAMELVRGIAFELKNEFSVSDPDVTVTLKKQEKGTWDVLTSSSLVKTLFLLRSLPCGVQNMSMAIPGLVETSLNAGIMVLKEDAFSLSFSVRSSVTSRKYEVADRLTFITEFLGGQVTISGDYPAWEYKADSDMRELMIRTYRDLFQEEPQIQAIHAGLECGIFSGKLEGLDCISFGPANFDIHTPKERLSIASTEKVWKLILEFLKRSK